jgi:hypothetical protein
LYQIYPFFLVLFFLGQTVLKFNQTIGPLEIYEREVLNHKSFAPQIANDTLLDDEFAIALKMLTAPIMEDLATMSRIR